MKTSIGSKILKKMEELEIDISVHYTFKTIMLASQTPQEFLLNKGEIIVRK